MDLRQIRKFVGWCAVINYGLLFIVAGLLLFLRPALYDFSQLFFPVAEATYNMVILMALAFWEILVWVFAIIPYFVLLLIGKSRN
jgi:hypothetical protein